MEKERLQKIYKIFQDSKPAFFLRECRVQGFTKEEIKEFFDNLEF